MAASMRKKTQIYRTQNSKSIDIHLSGDKFARYTGQERMQAITGQTLPEISI